MRFFDANFVEYQPTKWLAFDDVLLMPQHSRIKSRNDPQLSLNTPLTSVSSMSLPIISANMDTITEGKMALAMHKTGGCGILHRFYQNKYGEKAFSVFMQDIKLLVDEGVDPAFSIGLSSEDFKIIDEVLKVAHRVTVCVDVAHGDQDQVYHHIRKLRLAYPLDKLAIIGGNICTPEGVQTLVEAGCNAIKVGVGPGFVCSTRIVTGHGIPQLSAIIQCRRALNGLRSNISLIADGGIKNSGDIVKALAAGANSVMIGSLFAGTDESPSLRYFEDCKGIFVEDEFGDHKKYRGQSSAEFNKELGKSVTAEGISTFVPCKGPVKEVIADLTGGIRSGLTYSGSKNLEELFDKASFIEITSAGWQESVPRG